ncbi:MAG: large-conductance mechanosensitive channel protein MscL [Ruminococcaceae bacterium]|nr:large-conductance mechanosensitive channel protein MscL [Oscillospiraceae bacterium]
MGFFADFKKFISRGNVIDMAVGVVVGGAFSKIVTTFVSSIITPCISMLTGGGKVAGQVILKEAVPATETAAEIPAIILDYGALIQAIIDFIIIAFCIFIVVRVITKMREKAESLKKKEEEQKPAAPPEPSAEEKLLTEIRDLLKENKQ